MASFKHASTPAVQRILRMDIATPLDLLSKLVRPTILCQFRYCVGKSTQVHEWTIQEIPGTKWLQLRLENITPAHPMLLMWQKTFTPDEGVARIEPGCGFGAPCALCTFPPLATTRTLRALFTLAPPSGTWLYLRNRYDCLDLTNTAESAPFYLHEKSMAIDAARQMSPVHHLLGYLTCMCREFSKESDLRVFHKGTLIMHVETWLEGTDIHLTDSPELLTAVHNCGCKIWRNVDSLEYAILYEYVPSSAQGKYNLLRNIFSALGAETVSLEFSAEVRVLFSAIAGVCTTASHLEDVFAHFGT